jgi:hypothetical protein
LFIFSFYAIVNSISILNFLHPAFRHFFKQLLITLRNWEEILMTAKNDEYLMEVTKTLYNLNADDMVRQRCQARMDAELQEQYLLKKIDTLTADNDKLTADNAAKDAEIEALKRKLAELQQNA